MRILVVEDDPTVQTLIKMVLEKNDHKVMLAETAKAGKKMALDNSNDLIVLDLGLPDGDGFEICKTIRKEGLTTPVLVLSAEKETEVKVKCLKIGADDYLTKPFDVDELSARIQAISRRSGETDNQETLSCGGLEVSLIDRSCTVNGVKIELTNNEFELLAYLLKNKGETITRDEIAQKVWNINFDTKTNYINVYVSYLRKKIRAHADNQYIETIRKKGFMLRCPEA